MAKKTKKKYVVIEAILIVLIIACIGCYISFASFKSSLFIPDYAPGTIDNNAIKEEESDENKTVSNTGGSVSLRFSDIVTVNKKEKKAKLFFKNPGSSTENIILYLIIRQNDKEIVLGSSDLIPAGYAIYEMKLDDLSSIPVGGYDGVLKSIYYNEKTNAREIIDSEINVKIEVQ